MHRVGLDTGCAGVLGARRVVLGVLYALQGLGDDWVHWVWRSLKAEGMITKRMSSF